MSTVKYLAVRTCTSGNTFAGVLLFFRAPPSEGDGIAALFSDMPTWDPADWGGGLRHLSRFLGGGPLVQLALLCYQPACMHTSWGEGEWWKHSCSSESYDICTTGLRHCIAYEDI